MLSFSGRVLELLLFLFFFACLQHQQQQQPSALGAAASPSFRPALSRRRHKPFSSPLGNEPETVLSLQPPSLPSPSMRPRRGPVLRRDRFSLLTLISLSVPAFLTLLLFRVMFSTSKKLPATEELPADDSTGPAGDLPPSSPLPSGEGPLWAPAEGPQGGAPGEIPAGPLEEKDGEEQSKEAGDSRTTGEEEEAKDIDKTEGKEGTGVAVKITETLSPPPPCVAECESWKPTGDKIKDLMLMLHLWGQKGVRQGGRFKVESDSVAKPLIQFLEDGVYLKVNAEEMLRREKEKGEGGVRIAVLEDHFKTFLSVFVDFRHTLETAFFWKYKDLEGELRWNAYGLTEALQRRPDALPLPPPEEAPIQKLRFKNLFQKAPLPVEPAKTVKPVNTVRADEVIKKMKATAGAVRRAQDLCRNGNPLEYLKLESSKLPGALNDLENSIKEAVKVLNEGFKSYEKEVKELAWSPELAAILAKKD